MADSTTKKSKYRLLTGYEKSILSFMYFFMIITGALWIFDLAHYLGLVIMKKQFVGLILGVGLAAIYWDVPAFAGRFQNHVPLYDKLFAVLSIIVGLYIAIFYKELQYQLSVINPTRIILGSITMILIIEAMRRLTGKLLVFLLLFFILYGRFADCFSGILMGRSIDWPDLLNYLYLDTNGVTGVPLTVASTIVLAFILLGNLLTYSGGAAFFMDIALSMMGRYRGGTAKMAVISSSLFGTISGSVVGNVVSTGVITIPMMKKNGFKAKFAGAIEAASSTGGQLVPPVMGATAFLIAELLAVEYYKVALAAVIPATFYYIALFVQIDLEAAKNHLLGLHKDRIPVFHKVFKAGWIAFTPLAVLLIALFFLHYPPDRAGLTAVIILVVLNLADRKNRMKPSHYHEAVIKTGRGMLEIISITAAAGIIIGVLNVSGLGFGLSMGLVETFQSNLFLLILFSAVVCIVLGMGMPTAAVYLLLAVLVAPALIEMGIEPMGAHFFIFYFGMMSMITPPVCFAAYAAAAIAETHPIKLGFIAVRLAISALIIPFVFIFDPNLMMIGTPMNIILAFFSGAIGCFFVGVGLAGYLFRPIYLPVRAILIAAGLLMLIPDLSFGIRAWQSDLVGLLITLLFMINEIRIKSNSSKAEKSVAKA